MGSLAEAWAKQRAHYDRMALIEKAKYQRARADAAEAALAEARSANRVLRDIGHTYEQERDAARALADELAEALRDFPAEWDRQFDWGRYVREPALAKWEASRAK